MFSPDVSLASHPQIRSKRSRRQGSEESIKLPQAKKRRSALRKDTFEPLQDTIIPTEASIHEDAAVQANGHAPEDKASTNGASTRSTELALRGGKKPEKRSERGDGPFVLVRIHLRWMKIGRKLMISQSSNDYYSVAQLPALPEQIRSHSSSMNHCSVSQKQN